MYKQETPGDQAPTDQVRVPTALNRQFVARASPSSTPPSGHAVLLLMTVHRLRQAAVLSAAPRGGEPRGL